MRVERAWDGHTRRPGGNRPTFLDREIVFSADEIPFVDPEHAAVWYLITVDGNPVLSRHRGDGVLVDDKWLMVRTTFVDIMLTGGVTVPLIESGLL